MPPKSLLKEHKCIYSIQLHMFFYLWVTPFSVRHAFLETMPLFETLELLEPV